MFRKRVKKDRSENKKPVLVENGNDDSFTSSPQDLPTPVPPVLARDLQSQKVGASGFKRSLNSNTRKLTLSEIQDMYLDDKNPDEMETHNPIAMAGVTLEHEQRSPDDLDSLEPIDIADDYRLVLNTNDVDDREGEIRHALGSMDGSLHESWEASILKHTDLCVNLAPSKLPTLRDIRSRLKDQLQALQVHAQVISQQIDDTEHQISVIRAELRT